MANTPRHLAFSERLKQALTRCSRVADTPSKLAREFNLQYAGPSVSNQAVQKWLSGESIPKHDKMATLAAMCNVSVMWLSGGAIDYPAASNYLISEQQVSYTALSLKEQVLLEQFRKLTPHQQSLISSLTDQLVFERNLRASPLVTEDERHN